MSYTNSPLVVYKKISPNKTSPRNHVIDTITIHCMAGNLSIETCGNVFAPSSAQASSNYGIGSDGRIAIYVEEKDRSWASSNSANDNRAVTIEVANDGGSPDWHVSDKAMKSLIELVTDICKRNGIKKLVWSTNKTDRVNHKNGCNMTVHRDFAAKACPGDFLYGKHSYIADEVNKKLGISSTNSTNTSNSKMYRVRKSWSDALTQIGAYSSLENAKAACKEGYSVFDSNGKAVYTKTTNSTTKKTIPSLASATPNLKQGSTGTQVGYLQEALNYLGFKGKDNKPLTVDKNFGANTDYALRAFQKKYGLTVDGIYGSASKSKMKTLLV